MRTAFIEELVVLARGNPRIFLTVGDLGYSVVEAFASEFPDRFLNAGVAEQNMTGLAAGLASEGYHVFTYSIANFPTFRCAEQIRNDVAYHGLAVTIVAVGGGFAYGNLGYSHHAVQDLALMRTFPGMLVAAPGDPEETRASLRFLCDRPGPSYLRLGKAGEPVVHDRPVRVLAGIPVLTRDVGGRNAVLTTGASLKMAVDTAGQRRGWDVYSLPVWNSNEDAASILGLLGRYEHLLILEDHLAAGGFVSYVRECIGNRASEQGKIHGISLDSRACESVATQRTLNANGGLSLDSILDRMQAIEKLPLLCEKK
jgi:transketolase